MAKYDEFLSPKHEGRPVLVEAARRDGSGKNIENNYAKQNGYYQGMTVAVADNLSPYDESSGASQDTPFSFQATGTGNGTQPDFSTGELALLKEKQGNTVVVNQHQNSNNTVHSGTINASDYSDIAFPIISGYHKVTCILNINITTASSNMKLSLIGIDAQDSYKEVSKDLNSGKGTYFITAEIKNFGSAYNSLIVRVKNSDNSNSMVFQDAEVYLVDLTQWFGSNDNIPAHLLAHPEDFFRYYQGSLAYNTGELVNADGRYLKAIGMNQWDEEWEEGSIDQAGDVIAGSAIHSKNAIKVIPNTDYYFKVGTGGYLIIDWFDKDGNNVGYLFGYGRNDHYKAPANAVSMKFAVVSGYGTTYNNDITISIYYEGESGYDQYYPYQVLTNNDTGTETLRSAGSVKDSKAPDGTIIRRVGVVDLGSLSWHYDSNNGYFIAEVSGIKQISSPTLLSNISCNKYMTVKQTEWNLYDKVITLLQTSNVILIHDTSLNGDTTAISGTLYYELAKPTTEQGTPYSENLVIDDFGSMSWDSDVPQGNLIFYPVDYKAFVDTMYNYTQGTPSNLVLQSERTADKAAQASTDSALQAAVGGTLRQCLCVKESLDFDNTAFVDLGTLTWVVTGGALAVHFTNANSNKILSSMYKTGSTSEAQDKSIVIKDITYNYYNLIVYDSSYTDATAFKNAMKGVLLAYEKAE